jgi:hypothetical protein
MKNMGCYVFFDLTILGQIMKAVHKQQGQDLKTAITQWNELMIKLRNENKFKHLLDGPSATHQQIQFILEQSYARACSEEAHILNVYEGFSSNVYGEIKASFVRQLIQTADIQPHHIFLDMVIYLNFREAE